jgi:hypothetical protein
VAARSRRATGVDTELPSKPAEWDAYFRSATDREQLIHTVVRAVGSLRWTSRRALNEYLDDPSPEAVYAVLRTPAENTAERPLWRNLVDPTLDSRSYGYQLLLDFTYRAAAVQRIALSIQRTLATLAAKEIDKLDEARAELALITAGVVRQPSAPEANPAGQRISMHQRSRLEQQIDATHPPDLGAQRAHMHGRANYVAAIERRFEDFETHLTHVVDSIGTTPTDLLGSRALQVPPHAEEWARRHFPHLATLADDLENKFVYDPHDTAALLAATNHLLYPETAAGESLVR